MSNGNMLSVRNRQSSGFRFAGISHHPCAITSLSYTVDLYSAQFINLRSASRYSGRYDNENSLPLAFDRDAQPLDCSVTISIEVKHGISELMGAE